MSESPAPGWYADTSMNAPSGRMRYWTGSTWTDEVRDAGRHRNGPSPRPLDTRADAPIPLGPIVGAVAGGALIIGLLQHATWDSSSALTGWFTRIALPIALLVVIAAAFRKVQRWDLVARNGAIAIAAASIAALVLARIDEFSRYFSGLSGSMALASGHAGPFFGRFVNASSWYRYVGASILITAVIGACAMTAAFWGDRQRLPLAAGAGAAVGALLTLLLSSIDLFRDGRPSILTFAVPMLLWLPLTMLAAVKAGEMASRTAPTTANGSAPMYAAPTSSGTAPSSPIAGNMTLATLGSRIGARLIDGLLLLVVEGAVLAVVVGVAASNSNPGAAIGAILLAYLVVGIVGICYEPLFLTKRGATPGKKAVGICVVNEDNGAKITSGQAWGRSLLPAAWLWIPLLGFIVHLVAVFSASSDPKRRTWMDKAAHTMVVRAHSVGASYAPAAAAAQLPWQPPTASMPAVSDAYRSPVAAPPFVPVMPMFDNPQSPPWAAPVAPSPATTPAHYAPPAPAWAAPAIGQPAPFAPIIEQVPGIISTPAATELAPVVATAAAAPPRMFDDYDANATIHSASLAQLRQQRRIFTLEFSTGQRAHIESGRLIVGRDPQVVVANDDAKVITIVDPDRLTSRTHLVFAVVDGHLNVEDAHSANGSAVIGSDGVQSPLAPGTSVTITDGTRVLFGGCDVRVSVA